MRYMFVGNIPFKINYKLSDKALAGDTEPQSGENMHTVGTSQCRFQKDDYPRESLHILIYTELVK